MENNTRVITGLVRFSYLKVWEAEAMGEGQKPKFSVSLIIPKTDTVSLARINKAIENAKAAGLAKFGGSIPKKLDICLRDGDVEKEDEAYENSFYINAKSDRQPGIVDAQVQPILNQDDLYSGAYGKAAITFYAYNFEGKKGIAASLDNIQKIKDGDPLGGARHKAEDDFEAYEDFM